MEFSSSGIGDFVRVPTTADPSIYKMNHLSYYSFALGACLFCIRAERAKEGQHKVCVQLGITKLYSVSRKLQLTVGVTFECVLHGHGLF